jgi:HK97 family phage major capsid protein
MSRLTKLEQEAREAYENSVEKLDEQDSRIQALPEDCPEEERQFHAALFEKLEEDSIRHKETWERQVALTKARLSVPPSLEEQEAKDGDGGNKNLELRHASISDMRRGRDVIRVGKEPLVYEAAAPHSYFRDLVWAELHDDADARERLGLHGKQVMVERRDVSTASPGTASFIPPLYMGQDWIDTAIAGRPFADLIPKMPLPPQGKTMDFPRVKVTPLSDVQAAEANAVTEVDFDGETYSVPKVTIAGQNDVSIQALEFTDPSIDTVIMRELVKTYNRTLDLQLIYGTGLNGQHTGISAVVGINTEAMSSGNGAGLLGHIYAAQSQIATNAPGYEGSHVLLHPRRAAWLASHRDASGNLFQQGQLFLAAGGQDGGFVGNIAGLSVVRDPNIATNLGGSTNQDDVYVLAMDELVLAEGTQRTRVLQEVLSGTLQVRIQLYAYSAFAGGRRPKIITKISGAGLATPTFPST